MLRGHLQKTLGIGASTKMPAIRDTSVLIIARDQARADSIVFSGAVHVDGSVGDDIRCHRLVVAGRGRVDGALALTPAASQSGASTLCAPSSQFATTLSMKRGTN